MCKKYLSTPHFARTLSNQQDFVFLFFLSPTAMTSHCVSLTPRFPVEARHPSIVKWGVRECSGSYTMVIRCGMQNSRRYFPPPPPPRQPHNFRHNFLFHPPLPSFFPSTGSDFWPPRDVYWLLVVVIHSDVSICVENKWDYEYNPPMYLCRLPYDE